MEKEEIFSTLSGKIGETSLSERTINDYIAENLPTEGAEPDEAYWERHARILKSLGGNLNRDVAATVKTQIEDFKKNYKPQTTAEHGTDDGSKDETGDPEIKALKEQIAELKRLYGEQDEKNRSEALRRSVLDNSGVNPFNKALWRDSAATVSVEKDDTEQTLLAKVKKTYEKKVRDYFGDGARPYGGEGGGGNAPAPDSEEVRKRREEYKKRMKAQGRL